jgi:hypothetical protein
MFSTEEESNLAAERLNGVDLNGRHLQVNPARPFGEESTGTRAFSSPGRRAGAFHARGKRRHCAPAAPTFSRAAAAASFLSMSRPCDHPLDRLQREEAALYENVRDWRFDGVTREFAALHALLDSQFRKLGNGSRCGQGGAATSVRPRAVAVRDTCWRRPDGTYDVRESEIVAGLADLHLAMSSNLENAAKTLRITFGDIETAAFLSQLAGHHKKDASMLRALLWEDKPQ